MFKYINKVTKVSLFAAILFIHAHTLIAFPYNFYYSGRLTDATGKPQTGPVDLSVTFYHVASEGSPAFGPTNYSEVPLDEGVFQLKISLTGAQFDSIFSHAAMQVFIEIADVTNSITYPRQEFGVVPYALKIPVDGTTINYNSSGQLKVGALTKDNLAASGSSGQFLKVGGSGALEWSNLAGGGDMVSTNNLSELSDKTTARTNLELGSLATKNTVTSSDITNGTIALADLSQTMCAANQILQMNSAGNALICVALPASGETNTAANVGTGGVGVYLQKSSAELQFKNLNAGSNKISVANDAGNSEVDIDVNEANLTLTNIGGTLSLAKGGTGATGQAGAANAVLPPQASNSGKYLKTDGSNASWDTPTVTSDIFNGIQVFTSSGTFTVPAGITKVWVEVWGGGGGGYGDVGTTGGGASSFGAYLNASGGAGGVVISIATGGSGSGGHINLTGDRSLTLSSGGCYGGSSPRGGIGGYNASGTIPGGGGGALSGCGGGGGYAEEFISGLTPGATITVTVGSGGTGGSISFDGYSGYNGAAGMVVVRY